MNWNQILSTIQELRANLDTWGITSQTLALVGFLALIAFAFSLREVIQWYLGTAQLRLEVQRLNSQLTHLQKLLQETQDLIVQPELAERAAIERGQENALTSSTERNKPSHSPRFRFDH